MVFEVSSERRCGLPKKRENRVGDGIFRNRTRTTGYVLYILSQVCHLLLKSKLKYYFAEIVFFIHDPP